MLLRDTTDTTSHSSSQPRVRFSSIFYSDSRHPEGRSCTPFRRTISAYLKSIRNSVGSCVLTSYALLRTCKCNSTCTYIGLQTDTCAPLGETRMQKLAGTPPETQHQYIIEIYKFSSESRRWNTAAPFL